MTDSLGPVNMDHMVKIKDVQKKKKKKKRGLENEKAWEIKCMIFN